MRFRAPSIFYGWYIVGAGLAINMLMGGLVMHAFGFYAVALKDEFAWSATVFGIAAAVTRVESGLLGPIQGAMVDRFGPRAMMRLGVTTTALGMILFALVWDEVSFVGFYILLSIGTSIGGFMTVSVAVVTWFERKRSRAIGLMSMGFTFGSIVAIIASVLIFEFGWRETSAGTGVFMLIVGWALSSLFLRHPSDKGLEVDGGPEPVEGTDDEAPAAGSPRPVVAAGNPHRHRDFTAREALRTRAFWALALAHGAPLMVIGMWLGHGVLHIAELPGFTAANAQVVVLAMVVSQLVGQALSAYGGDRYPKRPLLIVCMLGHALGGIALALAESWWMLMAFALLNGLAWGGRGTLITSLRADYFGASQFGRIMGWTSMVMMPFMTIGMLGSGIMRDWLGSYDIAFIVLSIGAATGVLWILMAGRPTLPRTRPPARVSMIGATAPQRES